MLVCLCPNLYVASAAAISEFVGERCRQIEVEVPKDESERLDQVRFARGVLANKHRVGRLPVEADSQIMEVLELADPELIKAHPKPAPARRSPQRSRPFEPCGPTRSGVLG